jgi:phage terminase Nu1 subunit (DNA packaging protein)
MAFQPESVSTEELAEILGISRQQVNAGARAGYIVRTGRGRFDLRASVGAYCGHLRDLAQRKSIGDPDMKAARVRLTVEQADKVALANARARGELLHAADVEQEWAGVLRDLRAALLALPSRLGARLGHLTRHDLDTVDRELRDALSGLSGGEDG